MYCCWLLLIIEWYESRAVAWVVLRRDSDPFRASLEIVVVGMLADHQRVSTPYHRMVGDRDVPSEDESHSPARHSLGHRRLPSLARWMWDE